MKSFLATAIAALAAATKVHGGEVSELQGESGSLRGSEGADQMHRKLGPPQFDTVGSGSAPFGMCEGNCNEYKSNKLCDQSEAPAGLWTMACFNRRWDGEMPYEDVLVPYCGGTPEDADDYCTARRVYTNWDDCNNGWNEPSYPHYLPFLSVVADDGDYIEGSDTVANTPLGLCQGDCENDDDCEDGLLCFMRGEGGIHGGAPVPGCYGVKTNLTDPDFLDNLDTSFLDNRGCSGIQYNKKGTCQGGRSGRNYCTHQDFFD